MNYTFTIQTKHYILCHMPSQLAFISVFKFVWLSSRGNPVFKDRGKDDIGQ